MAKRQPAFVCQSCGAVYNRWKGKCEACGGWNTIVEETGSAIRLAGPVATRPSRAKGRVFPLEGLPATTRGGAAHCLGIAELDRVTGGGFVPGSVMLLGGDPGIGKSTLLMQASRRARARRAQRVVYISGEEAVGAGAPARRAARPRRRAGRTRRRDQRRGHHRDALRRAGRPHLVDHRLDPDHVDRGRRSRRPARSRQVRGRRAGADPLREDDAARR